MRLFTTLIMLLLALAGCSSGGGDDLDQWMNDRKAHIHGKVQPLPELKPYVPFIYNADGSLHDPFSARRAADSNSSGLKPDFSRPKEPLEAFPLESLKFVGFLQQGKKNVALVAAPDNTVYQVKAGNYMGQNFGLVTSLNKDEITVKEMIQDPTGRYVERRVTINPQE